MPTIECTADLGHPCDGDNGEPCPSCKSEHAYWRAQWGAASPSEKLTPEQYREEMIDAGRGHLLGDE